MKHSISSFAKEIRKQYPGDYDDLTDEVLVNLWLKKYPEDISKIEVIEENINEEDSFNWSKFLVLCLLGGIVGIGISYFSATPTERGNVNEKLEDLGVNVPSNIGLSNYFSLSDLEYPSDKPFPIINLNFDSDALKKNKIIKKEGDSVSLLNVQMVINDKYKTNLPDIKITGGKLWYDESKFVILGENDIIYLNGNFADENGNRFNFNETKILKVYFNCDQFSLEKEF